MTWLDIDWAVGNIRGFNTHAETLANDRLMHRVFSDRSAKGPSAAERVVLLDKLWSTQMFWQTDHALKVIENLRRSEGRILKAIHSLDPDTLERRPEAVIRMLKWAMPIVLGHRPGDGDHPTYSPYSFASKYLHWTAPHLFPIMDSRARFCINQLQRKHGLRPRVLAAESTGWKDDYPRWIHFYSQLLGELKPIERTHLLRADLESQPAGDPRRNTLIRVLDKAFYWDEFRTHLPTP